MYLDSKKKEECCGCSACYSVCPKKCISMEKDEYGFAFPVINNIEECISCGLCRNVCPFENIKQIKSEPMCFYGWHKDESVRQQSTSGAAFVAIAQICNELENDFYYGAAYSEDMLVQHQGVNDLEKIDIFKTSKYLQSDMGNNYCEIKEHLKDGKKVLFSGTPCQVDGLNRFIPNKYKENLLTIALVCHGVASPACYKVYLKQLEEKNKDYVNNVRFRDKCIKDGKLNHRFTTISMKSGKQIRSTENSYTMAFGIGLMQRESCFHCPFTTIHREADITIGDFWGIENYMPELKEEVSKGISLILAHTEKGKKIIESLQNFMNIKQVPVSYAVNPRQQQLSKPMEENAIHNKFMHRIVCENKDFEKESAKYIRRWKIKRSISVRLKKLYLKIFGENKNA